MGGMGMGLPRRTIPKTEARLFRIPKAEARLNASKTRGVPFCFWLFLITKSDAGLGPLATKDR